MINKWVNMTLPNKLDHPRQPTESVQAEYVRIRRTLRLVVGSRESALQAGKYAPSAWARTSANKADSVLTAMPVPQSISDRNNVQCGVAHNIVVRVGVTCTRICQVREPLVPAFSS